MTNGANYKSGNLHHSPGHCDIRTSNQVNKRNEKGPNSQKEKLAMLIDWKRLFADNVGGAYISKRERLFKGDWKRSVDHGRLLKTVWK